MDLTTLREAKDYFSRIADEHVDINGYHYGDMSVLQQAVRSVLKLPVLWQEPYLPVIVEDNLSDNHTGVVTQTVAIYTKPDSDKHESLEEAYELCEQIVKDIIGRMLRDHTQGNIKHRPGSFKYGQSEDLVGSTRLIGCRLDITYLRPERLIYDENKWQ